MNIRRISILITGAVAAVPLMACGSSAEARPVVPTMAAQAVPVVHSMPASLARPAGAHRPAAAHRPAEHATSPIRQPWVRGSIVRVGWIDGYRALVDRSGRALYMFTPDWRGYSTCYRDCARVWPAFYGPARAGVGVHPWALGYTTRRDGRIQVTYHGHPLYHYSGDWWPGEARGQGLDGTWYLIVLMGNPIGGWRHPVR